MKTLRVVLVALAVSAAFAACGTSAHKTPLSTAAQPSTAADDPGPGVKRTPPLKSPDLAISVEPTSGPPGTVVTIEVSGCNDPSGLNHAISFNNDPGNRSERFSTETVKAIESTQRGTQLSATYTIQPMDRRARTASFIVQCSDGLAASDFAVTSP